MSRARKRGTTRLTAKNQVTLPVDALRAAGVQPGERLAARADGPGRIVLEREVDALDQYAGALTGVWPPEALDELRDEWD
ncbi:MAG TPA: AbrB/MazE/SpoVT family DNA-binding domain-containing protein [Iamia sp.]|jgi:bifunctional DNA-binding transcriptional regulator/antitoxin component of YhaV-PrlF toxin-antitoxin module|nr:AbrB/MazE/SpoVT family DNA-binding domain-containing protein [Iamia sp.]